MNIEQYLKEQVKSVLSEMYQFDASDKQLIVNQTNAEIEGDYTIVLFPFVKLLSKSPVELGNSIGERLQENSPLIDSYSILKGFLNIILSDAYYLKALESIVKDDKYGYQAKGDKTVLVEYSSPNTNKPLHLGHIRNILLGWSAANLLDAAGYNVIRTQIVNDRGIAICKSMLAWKLYGNNATPESSSVKGDHFVGDYYVMFETKFKTEYNEWQLSEQADSLFKSQDQHETKEAFFKVFKNTYFNEYSQLGAQAKEMLIQWEKGDKEIRSLWEQMNSWVYQGFDETYKRLGVYFDSYYYESDTYILGKDHIEKGLATNHFYKKEDGSVWIDLEDAKLDHKLVLRSDGTSVYMTQDIGTAYKRYEDTGAEKMIYVVADEQDYHFKVLFEICKRLGFSFAEGLHHLSYGMVDLPTGKMKSREGTVVDADDLITEIISEAASSVHERGDLENLTVEDKYDIFRKIGLAALKFFILKVSAKKRMVFDPKESLDMQGQTGPYIQNAYVRIQSVLRKWEGDINDLDMDYDLLETIEKDLIKELTQYPKVLQLGAEQIEPSHVANYCYSLAKLYHRFYHDCRILSAPSENIKQFRLLLSQQTAMVLKSGMNILGIEMPNRM